jgi:transcriptional regulator with XRE-family HTH domain
MTTNGSIGERVRQLRTARMPRVTQRELAEKAGVSVDLISKLEQGTKQSALLTSLSKIARALDVDVSALVSRPVRVDVAGEDRDSGVLAVRRAITTVREDGEPATDEELRKSATLAWGHYWTNQFDVLAGMLPELIASARATVRQSGSPVAHEALSDAYGAAASMLVHLDKVDLAYLAMERAIREAENSEDDLRRSSLYGWLSWLLLHQTGRSDEAKHIATREADSIEPKIKGAPPEQVSVWGSLLVGAAVAAAREDNASEADDVINLAEVAATRLDGMGWNRRMYNQSPFGLPLVTMQGVDIAVVTGRPGRALTIAEKMPPDAPLPLASKARHLADKAFALTELGRLREAEDTLYTIKRTAPKWMTYQSYPRVIVAELWEREKRSRSVGLRNLAEWLSVPLN